MKETILSLLLGFILQTGGRTTISGIAVDSETDRPVAGVQISVLATALPGDAGLQATTDNDGRFTISPATPGSYNLSTSKEGYAPARVDGRMLPGNSGIPLTVKAGEPVGELQIHIAKSAVITGRVLDSNGQPVTRARVAAMRKNYDENGVAGLTLARNAGTDDRGEYREFGLEPGQYYVFVDSVSMGEVSTIPTYFPGTSDAAHASPVGVKAGSEVRLGDLTLPTRKGATIRLHIENMTGQTPQIMNVEVRKDGVMVANRGIPAPIGMDVFSLSSLSPGAYEFAVGLQGSEGFYFSHTTVPLDDSNVDANVTVRKGWQVTGRAEAQLADGTMRPVAGVNVMLGTPGSADTSSGSSGDEGTFTLTGVSDGLRRVRVSGLASDAYVLAVQEADHDILSEGIRIVGDTSIHVVIGTSGGTVKGITVNSVSKVVAGGIVALIPDEPNRTRGHLYRTATSDQNGEFVIQSIAPGAYHLYAWRELEGA
ncbi:MAG TPA: carboxypeptidase regulatory-like domain-containing protein, partial [Terriglobia bacterium]|nr:carboxypeptidase regulatory-like domain-containing protein [Terriglobia bacterium]